MKRFIFVLLLFILLSGCGGRSTAISAQKAKELLENDSNVILLDVRTEEEYNEERIENAILLPVDDIEAKAHIVIPNKNKTYIVYCRTGRRSANAVLKLIELGYKNVYDLGGIVDWPYEKVTG